MNDRFRIISETTLFHGLPGDQLKKIDTIAVEKNVAKGRLIFAEGDEGNGFYIVKTGKVKIYKLSTDGKEQILHIFGPGEPFGEVPMFTSRPFPANAQAIATSQVLFFPKKSFIALIADNPSLALNMLGVLSMRLRQFTVQVENLSLKEIPGRLAGYLLYLSEEQQNTRTVSLKISKSELAGLLGTIPETLSRIFAKMNSIGLIEVDGRDIRLNDIEGLEELSEQGKI